MVPVVFYDPTKPALTVEPRNSYLLKCHGYIWDIVCLIVSSLMENRRSILTPPHCECFVCGVQPLNSRPHHFVSVLDRIDADLQQTALNYSMNRFLLSFYACIKLIVWATEVDFAVWFRSMTSTSDRESV